MGPRGRCSATRFLEWHHVQPFGDQGPATVENISLRCRAHNVYESNLVFGPFDASAARRKAEMYRVSREYTPFQNGGAGGGAATTTPHAGAASRVTPLTRS